MDSAHGRRPTRLRTSIGRGPSPSSATSRRQYLCHLRRSRQRVSSPPVFAWDDWYETVGGRSGRIPEVDDILRQIYDGQYARFDGPVAETRHRFASSAEASGHIKAKALEFGADIVGICEI